MPASSDGYCSAVSDFVTKREQKGEKQANMAKARIEKNTDRHAGLVAWKTRWLVHSLKCLTYLNSNFHGTRTVASCMYNVTMQSPWSAPQSSHQVNCHLSLFHPVCSKFLFSVILHIHYTPSLSCLPCTNSLLPSCPASPLPSYQFHHLNNWIPIFPQITSSAYQPRFTHTLPDCVVRSLPWLSSLLVTWHLPMLWFHACHLSLCLTPCDYLLNWFWFPPVFYYTFWSSLPVYFITFIK